MTKGKHTGVGIITTCVQILPLPLISLLGLDKLFKLFEPQCLYLLNADKDICLAGMLRGSDEIMYVKHLVYRSH